MAREGARSFVVIKRAAPLFLSSPPCYCVYYYRLISNFAVKARTQNPGPLPTPGTPSRYPGTQVPRYPQAHATLR